MSGNSHCGSLPSGWNHMKMQPYCSSTGYERSRRAAIRLVGLVRDVAVGAVRAPAPAVEGAFDAVVDDLAAVADVRAEVLAVRLQQMQVAGLVAVGDQVLAEILQRRARRRPRTPADQPIMNQPVTFQVNGTFTQASEPLCPY